MDAIERYEKVEHVIMRFLEPVAVSDGDEGQADFMKLNRDLEVAAKKL